MGTKWESFGKIFDIRTKNVVFPDFGIPGVRFITFRY